jgi:hypothetical protein
MGHPIVGVADYLPVLANMVTRKDLVPELAI